MPDTPDGPGKLLAVSDLHVSYPQNRQWVEDLPPGSAGDWLLVVGDVAERVADIEWTLRTLTGRFGTVVWVPGNHDLWSHPADPVKLRGEERYQHLVARCRELGLAPAVPRPGRRLRPPAYPQDHLAGRVRFEEVSLGYPQEQEKYPNRPRRLTQILPSRSASTAATDLV